MQAVRWAQSTPEMAILDLELIEPMSIECWFPGVSWQTIRVGLQSRCSLDLP